MDPRTLWQVWVCGTYSSGQHVGQMGIYKGQDLFISLDGLIDGLFLELIKLAIQI